MSDMEMMDAMTADQFGRRVGKNGAWTRRMVHSGKLKAIRGWGEMMIPTSEIDRIMESAAKNLSNASNFI
tara:strand:+ start:862 stop:1071 length:210 start_codon:yes stop_codon:yes gene_type:complete